ncbi:MAG TPA: FAD-dependent oxidoreductase [Geminicoccaceae bacterium]
MTADLAYRRSPDQDRREPARHPVVIVGAGPVGLALAIDLRLRGVEPVVLEADTALATGSRAICYAKRSLEILDRLGVAARMVEKGVVWQIGKVFWRDRMVYQFDLLPERGHKMPAFVNLQQFHLERYLVERARELGGIDLRFGHPVTGVEPADDGARLAVDTPEGPYRLSAEWLLACDGARSLVRRALDLPFEGQVFRDRFLITDVRMAADFPPERWFWFDPPFHPGRSALLHAQPDDVWRIDLQLGWDVDPEAEVGPERVIPRLKAMLGPSRPFEIEWVSLYTFRCRRLREFRHGRVIFLGDAAHQVSPFGARGFNGGLQDADNLAWKLALVLGGAAPEALLDSYAAEREAAADENIRHSTRSTEFISPKGEASRAYRDAVLALAPDHGFARRMINSGRLSTACTYGLGDGAAGWSGGGIRPGAPCADAPLLSPTGRPAWLLERLGHGFTLLRFARDGAGAESPLPRGDGPVTLDEVVIGGRATPWVDLVDAEGLAFARYAARPGNCLLIRPDQHVAARFERCEPQAVARALRRALGEDAPARTMAGT